MRATNFGYFPEPTKSILVVPPEMVDRATEYLQDLHFKITTGSRYLLTADQKQRSFSESLF
jgi:hypothetical protein